jgi:hypothetical protein
VPGGDPVHGVGIVRYADAVSGQLVPKSYRPRARGPHGRRQARDPFRQLLRQADQRLPDPLAVLPVERREYLAPEAVQDRQSLPLAAGLADPAPERVERADAGDRNAEPGAEPARRGDADPQPGEGAGAEADRDQVDPRPTPRRCGRPLDLLQQRRRMAGPPSRGEPQLRLEQSLAVAPGAGGGIGGRGVEADYDQRASALSP